MWVGAVDDSWWIESLPALIRSVDVLLWLEHTYHPGKGLVRMSAHQSYRPDDKRKNHSEHDGVFSNALTVFP